MDINDWIWTFIEVIGLWFVFGLVVAVVLGKLITYSQEWED